MNPVSMMLCGARNVVSMRPAEAYPELTPSPADHWVQKAKS